MKKQCLFAVMVLGLFILTLGAQNKGPVTVSPADAMGVAKVGTVCPTFSWTAVDWAAAYRVEVFPAQIDSELTHAVISGKTLPLLVKEIRGSATSWTPSKNERLFDEGVYVWFVEALDEYGSGIWSQGSLFTIEAEPGFAAFEDVVNETLEKHGVATEIIDDVITNLHDTQNLNAAGSTTPLLLSVQGVENGVNTIYGLYAGSSITTGTHNSLFGTYAGTALTTGSGNTYIGRRAGLANTTGYGNISIGYYSGESNTANENVFIGYWAGNDNTTGTKNTFVGTFAGLYNVTGEHNSFFGESSGAYTTGSGNSMFGSQSGYNNSTGYENVFMGKEAGYVNTAGIRNVFIGSYAGRSNTDADHGTFLGHYAGYKNTTGNFNTFLGSWSGRENTTGANNTFVGYATGDSNTTGGNNAFLGHFSGQANTIGEANAFLGYQSGYYNTEGIQNTFVGTLSGFHNTTANYNTFIGSNSGGANTTGNFNTYVGSLAGGSGNGNSNVFLGNQAGYNETGSNRLYIDNSDTSSPLIWGDFTNNIFTVHGTIGVGTKTPGFPMEMKKTGTNASIVVDRTDGATNYINATATSGNFGTVTPHVLRLVAGSQWKMRLFTDNSVDFRNGASITSGGTFVNASSRDLKENIHDLTAEEAIDALEDLNPVKYNYKADRDEDYLGFIAEDVPDLVSTKGRKGMAVMDVVAVLTKVVQELQKVADRQQKTIEALQKSNAILQRQIKELKEKK